MMQMPTVQEEHRKLEKLAGKWKGEEKIHPSPWDAQGGTATARVESRVDLDGFAVLTDYVEERNGQVSYRGHGVFGYDAEQKMYTMHWFDSMGGGGYRLPALGKWEGNTLFFQNETPMGHSRYTYVFEGAGYTFRIDASQDGKQWTPFMEGRYTRV
jgi:hypothetical protein